VCYTNALTYLLTYLSTTKACLNVVSRHCSDSRHVTGASLTVIILLRYY